MCPDIKSSHPFWLFEGLPSRGRSRSFAMLLGLPIADSSCPPEDRQQGSGHLRSCRRFHKRSSLDARGGHGTLWRNKQGPGGRLSMTRSGSSSERSEIDAARMGGARCWRSPPLGRRGATRGPQRASSSSPRRSPDAYLASLPLSSRSSSSSRSDMASATSVGPACWPCSLC